LGASPGRRWRRDISPALQDWISIFLGIVVEATPFLLLGVVVSSVVHVFVREDTLLRYVPKNPVLSVIPAIGMGMLMPVCECGNVAVARRFLAKGVPTSSCVAFLLAAPVLNPVALIATATAFRSEPSMVWLRAGLTFFIAAGVGLLVGQMGKGEEILAPGLLRATGRHTHPHDHDHSSAGGWPAAVAKLERSANHAGAEFMSMMQVLVFGASIAAATQVLIPRDAFTNLGTDVVLGIVAMMSLAFVLSICSTVDAFFALSYSNIFPMPALLAFLVLGPMMSMKGIGLLLTAFRPRVVVTMAAVVVELVLMSALLLNLRGVLL